MVTISTPLGGLPPASSGVAHPAGGASCLGFSAARALEEGAAVIGVGFFAAVSDDPARARVDAAVVAFAADRFGFAFAAAGLALAEAAGFAFAAAGFADEAFAADDGFAFAFAAGDFADEVLAAGDFAEAAAGLAFAAAGFFADVALPATESAAFAVAFAFALLFALAVVVAGASTFDCAFAAEPAGFFAFAGEALFVFAVDAFALPAAGPLRPGAVFAVAFAAAATASAAALVEGVVSVEPGAALPSASWRPVEGLSPRFRERRTGRVRGRLERTSRWVSSAIG